MRTATYRIPAVCLAFGIVALLFAAPATLRADGEESRESASLSDAVGDGLAKLKPLLDDKDWAGAGKLIDNLMTDAAPDSFDQAYLLETKAKILTMANRYPDALAPLEQSLAISDRHHFYNRQQTLDMLYFLSQLYYQQAEGAKLDHEAQMANYDKSIGSIQRWISLSPKLTPDISEYYSRLLYSEAVAKDEKHPDPELIRRARDQIEVTLHLSARPKESTYVFLLATLQQAQDYGHAAEVLELMLSKNPKNKTYWQDLVTFYIVLAQNNIKDPKESRKYNIRALNTLEHAQELGYMKEPRNNYLRFTLYYEMGQFGVAADVLRKGLEDGTIDSELDRWELLSASYQQINQDFTAIEVLKDAVKHYPSKGDLYLKIGGIYSTLEKGDEALKYYKLAEEKGGLGKSQRNYLLMAMAYQAYELQQFDDAKVAIDKALEAATQGGAKPDHQLLILKNAIEDAIKNRDEKKSGNSA
jgi:tetratricopeptide (TPR) repeat protein